MKFIINYSALDLSTQNLGCNAEIINNPYIEGDFYYSDETKTRLVRYIGNDYTVVIPNSVTEIGKFSFMENPNVTSITIGAGVLSVDMSAFDGRNSIHKITVLSNSIPSGLISYLGNKPAEGRIFYVANDDYWNINPYKLGYNNLSQIGTFKRYDFLSSYFEVDGIRYVPISPSERTCAAIDCTYGKDVKKVTLGKEVTYKNVKMKVVEINPYLFINNKALETLEVSLDYDIPECFAMGCVNLESFNLPENVTTVGKNSFYKSGIKYPVYNSNIFAFLPVETINYCVPEGIQKIAPTAFRDCDKLEKVSIPNVTTIEESTFSGCKSLQNIELPKALSTIKDCAFENSGLKSITIPAATTVIGDKVFNGCKALEKFEAKDGVESLSLGCNYKPYWYDEEGKGLFYDCLLKEVVIGRNLTNDTSKQYGYSPFYRNTSIESVTLTDIPTEVFTNEFYGCTGLKTVSIGDGVTHIGDYAFSGCSSIEEFSLGASVGTIGAEVFSDCTNMTKFYAEPATPPTCGKQALDDINKWNCTLYVNPNAKEDYQKADQWKEFFFMEDYDFSEVKFEVESITLSNTSIDMLVGETATITATVNPEDAADQTVAWSSSDENIVTVSNEGLIKAIAVGKVIVTAKCGEVTASCEVTVSAISKLTYTVDGEVVSSDEVKYGTTIVPIEEPTKEGYTFSGWSEIPETMPDHDVEVTGTFSINSYDLIYMLGDEEYQRQTYEFGSAIVPLDNPTIEGFIFHGWLNIPETMPAHDVTVYADMEVDGIESIFADDELFTIYNIQGTLIMKGATMDAVKLLPDGMYVINGKLVRLYRR